MPTEIWVQKLLKIAVILLGGLLTSQALRGVFKRAFKNIPGSRAKTLISITHNTTSFVLGIIVLGMILSELGLDIAPLIASAGILGLAIGFGSQALVKDLISGLFLLIEDTVRTGEIIQTAGVKGKVKKIGMRTMMIEDEEGVVHIIPNGSITTVANFSRKK
jgi:small-conductance mechanosensitive channel